MALHRLTSVTMGVPNVADTAAYYTEFGLTPDTDGWFTTRDAGRQLRIVPAVTRRLVEIRIGADTPDDLAVAAARLRRMDIACQLSTSTLIAYDNATGVRAVLEVTPRLHQAPVPPTPYNGPGRTERTGARAPGLVHTDRVRPRKLGHAVIGTTDLETTTNFFHDGLGFKASDYIKGHGAFLRCSSDHHNILVLAAPVSYLHHTSWQVDDIDDIGRGAATMLEGHPERHIWGLGRHHAGSNFFWYLKDPAGNFSEYYSDMDSIVEDELWTPKSSKAPKGSSTGGPHPHPPSSHPTTLPPS